MLSYESLDTEKYFDRSFERVEKRRIKFRSFMKTIWSMTAIMFLTFATGLFCLQFCPPEFTEHILSFVSTGG